jgi:hypothetical protein
VECCVAGPRRVGDDAAIGQTGLLKLLGLACGGFVFQFFVRAAVRGLLVMPAPGQVRVQPEASLVPRHRVPRYEKHRFRMPRRRICSGVGWVRKACFGGSVIDAVLTPVAWLTFFLLFELLSVVRMRAMRIAIPSSRAYLLKSVKIFDCVGSA